MDAETFQMLHKQNTDALEMIRKYILSTPWCEEGQAAFDETGQLSGFLLFFEETFLQMYQQMVRHGLKIEKTWDDRTNLQKWCECDLDVTPCRCIDE
jgi:hypothetical protein